MKETLSRLLDHETLSRQEAEAIIYKISSGKVNPSHLAAFMTVFMLRPVTVEELSGFRNALMELCLKVSFDAETIDVCGTGGDGKNTFNISTLSAFVVAGAGIKVAKHGNYGVSSVSGSSNVLEHFGYRFTEDAEVLKKQLDKFNLCFMHAPFFHPALKHVGPVRKELGMKTFFNMLGPLVNPADPEGRLIGVYSRELGRIYNYILQSSGKKYAVVCTDDGFDEISLTSEFTLFSHQGESRYSPGEIAEMKISEQDLFGGESVEEAARIFRNVLEGNGTVAQESVVEANSAFAMRCATGMELDACMDAARDSLRGGKALGIFKSIMNA